MNFITPLALLVGLLVALPVLAHALRKGKTSKLPFPAARLVPSHSSHQKERRKLEDRGLLLIRSLSVIALAVLAASPLVKCSRLALNRQHGASVAAALIIDNSASMRARTDQGTKLEVAVAAAMQLLDSAQPGDAFSVILAGAAAHVLTPLSSDLAATREAISQIQPTDRETDLAQALRLAQSIQAESKQTERPIYLLSDLAVEDVNALDLSDVTVPELGLRSPLENCALISASLFGRSVQVEVACTDARAIENREIRVVSDEGEVLGKPGPAQDGITTLPLDTKRQDAKGHIWVELTEPADELRDQIKDDDRAVVLDTSTRLTIALRADQSTGGFKTGAGTVIQAGLEALDESIRVEPLSLLPDSAEELSEYAALIVDDPSGLTPEITSAIERWMHSGGVGLVFLGPSVRKAPLGSNFEPFVVGAARWERTKSRGPSKEAAGALGPLSTTWSALGATHRAELDQQPQSVTLAAFDDGAPLVLEREVGRGLSIVVTLPSSVDQSDLALRPAFLELLDYAVNRSALRKGVRATPAGKRWAVSADTRVKDPLQRWLDKSSSQETDRSFVEPEIAGPYEIYDAEGKSGTRYAIRQRTEHVRSPDAQLTNSDSVEQQMALSEVEITREIALVLLLLALLELVVRLVRRPTRQNALKMGSS